MEIQIKSESISNAKKITSKMKASCTDLEIGHRFEGTFDSVAMKQ